MKTLDLYETKRVLREHIVDQHRAMRIAETMGIYPQAVYKWCNPKYMVVPSLDHLIELADILGVDMTTLVVIKEV